MRPDVEDLGLSIESVNDLVDFLEALSSDAVEHGSEWANTQIFDMLESMAAWLTDSLEDGLKAPDSPEALRFFARLLLAGKHYE